MADGKEFGPRPLGVLANGLGLGGKPVIEQREGTVSVNELFGVAVVCRNLPNAQVLVQFQDNLGQVLQPAQYFPPLGRAIIEVAGNQPIHIAGLAPFEGLPQARIPHLARINTPSVEDIPTPGQSSISKVQERGGIFLDIIGLAVHNRNGACILFPIRFKALD